MKQLKKPRTPEKEIPKGNNRKTNRPWVLEYQWVSREEWNKSSRFLLRGKDFSDEWWEWFGKYMDLDHAIEQLNKELRTSFNWLGRYVGTMNYRLHNRETKKKVYIEVRDNKIILKDELV